jgi:poly(A) polymerase
VTTDIEVDLKARVLSRPEHSLSRKSISKNTLKVMYRLQRAGYLAYLVGGGVRDILLGRRPKDFDVGTNARPGEIRRLFRNSRIIGRRFRLVHVFFKGEIIEVSTFRASPDAEEAPDDWSPDNDGNDEAGRLEEIEEIVANGHGEPEVEEYGTPEDDARRRDLTINGLFYNISDFSIIDHVGGLEDLEARLIRTIGAPAQRFEEDPVRMMRALEYAVRLGFSIEPETDRAIRDCADLITQASPARLTYELLEALTSGQAAGICQAWQRYGIFAPAFPEATQSADELIRVLEEVDRRQAAGDRLGEASLFGAIFLPRLAALLRTEVPPETRVDNAELLRRQRELLGPACAEMHVANRKLHLIHGGIFGVSKLRRPPERGRQVVKLVRQESFPVTWDLFTIGVKTGLLPWDTLEPWRRAIDQVRKLGADERSGFTLEGEKRSRRRRPRRRRRNARRS